MGKFNEQKYYQEYDQLPHGELAIAYLHDAIREADEVEDYDWQLDLRSELMSECNFYSDALEIYVIMPQMLKIYDEHTLQFGKNQHTNNVLWHYKWLLENSTDFYQISIEQFEGLAEDFKTRCLGEGYSLRTYYSSMFSFYKYIDWEKAEGSYQQFLKETRDSLSDCPACERHREVEYLLNCDDLERAKQRARDLFNRKMSCKEVPEFTYGIFLRYYNRKLCIGERDYERDAFTCCDQVVKSIRFRKIASDFSGDVLLYYSLTDSKKALDWFKQYWSCHESDRNPLSRLYFALGMTHFWKQLQAKESTYRMKLPSSFPLYREDGVYDLAKLREYYETEALSCARKLDERNGTSYFLDVYEEIIAN